MKLADKKFGFGCMRLPMQDGKLTPCSFPKCPAGRPATADEVANVAELLMSAKASTY